MQLKNSTLFYSLFLFVFLLVSADVFGRKDSVAVQPARNTIYLEAFGQGLLNSLSFDRLYRADKKINSSLSAGITIMPSIGISDFYSGAQMSYVFLYPIKNHHIECGLGINYLLDEVKNGVNYEGDNVIEKNQYLYFTPRLGYRFQRSQGGIFFRITFTPLIAFVNRVGAISVDHEKVVNPRTEWFSNVVSFGNKAFPWGGVSIGYTWQKKQSSKLP